MALSTIIHQCPVCSRLVTFSHEQITLIQCICSSVLERKDGMLYSKPYLSVQQPADLIQPGTEGKWNGTSFKVLGRFRAWIEEFVYNYWTVIFENNTIGYLAEGYGLYAILETTTVDINLAGLWETMATGETRELTRGQSFLLEKKYTCYKWEIEGEVNLPECEAFFRILEFAAGGGSHIEAMEFHKHRVMTFNVFYTSFVSLQLINTRISEPVKKVITCDRCLKPNELIAFPYCQSYACNHCGAWYVLQQRGGFKLENSKSKVESGSNIRLGSNGQIKGINYQVIGYALKEENKLGQSQWKEYTLYNQAEGFAFLSEYNGNWIYVREKGDAPVLEYPGVTTFTYNKEPFLLFNTYGFTMLQAAGEFPYNAFNDQDKEVKEFISPPEVWIQEKSKSEGIVWFLGEHISRGEVEMAFKDGLVMPPKVGVGAVEPKGYVSPVKILIVSFVAALVLILSHVFSTMADEQRVIVDETYIFKDSLNTFMFATEKFQLNKRKSNLRFEIHAPVDNSWLQLSATLVNATSGTEYNLSKAIEYYYGNSGGESWTEGSRSETANMSAIPAGTYFLQIEGARENELTSLGTVGNNKVDRFQLTVTYDTRNDRNLFVCLGILLIFSFVHYQVVQYNERSRWSNSPFSPFDQNYED